MGELHLVPALAALLRRRNVTAAAAELGITQSAMSHKLRRLRELLDDPLLVRGGRGMLLTERAEALRAPLRDAMAGLHEALRSPDAFDPATAKRTFAVATSDGGEMSVMASLIARLTSEAPGIDIHLERPTPSAWTDMEEGRLDAVVSPAPEAPAAFRRRLLSNEGFVVLARRGHPGTVNGLTLETYLAWPHVLVSPRGGPGIVDHVLGTRGLGRRVVLRTPHFAAAPHVVAGTDCFLTIPPSLGARVREHLPIDLHPCPLELPTIPVYLYWHARAHADAGHRWMRETLVAAVSGATA